MIARLLAASLAPLCGFGVALTNAPASLPGAIISCAAASLPHHVAVIVEHADGRVVRGCAGFDGATIDGVSALRASGVGYATVSYGPLGDAVCQLDGEPATYPPTCWTSTSPYWAMFTAHDGGAWHTTSTGLSSQQLRDGDAIGFRYDPQTGTAAAPRVLPTACTAAAATATAPAAAASVVGTGMGVSSALVLAIIAAAALIATTVAATLRRRQRA